MRYARHFLFEPFRLDVLDERLWEGEKSVPLGHKALAVLRRLVGQPGRLVTKDDLLKAAWPDTAVGEAVLTTAVRELRQVLGDPARAPRFIETVHGRGYRFIAPVSEAAAAPGVVAPGGWLVGREQEWRLLDEWYEGVQQGTRRIGFVAGEAGIGKTALLEAFASDLAAGGAARVARGQCVEHYGAGEAYLPILEALGRLGRDTGLPVSDVLRRRAPSWLAHLPSMRSGQGFETQAPVTPARMLRELADAMEDLTAQTPLVLVLEDLHWSDTATLEWLAYSARRRDPARLLVLGSYRPVEALLHNHTLRSMVAQLRPYPQCGELVLDYLSGDSVEAYLRQRCGPLPGLRELAEVLRRRTGGLPLFLATIVDELIRRGRMEDGLTAIASVIPATVRKFIEHQFERLGGEDQNILEAASVAGEPFPVAAVAAATGLSDGRVGARCADWAREGQFLAADGMVNWPDGTVAARYRFRHALFQEVVYARISPERRVRLHGNIGSRLESAYLKRTATIAAELAVHFELGQDHRCAVGYLEQAARNALQRSAYSEALRHLTRAREVIKMLPEGRARQRRELKNLLLLGHVLKTTKGWAVDEVERIYAQARELSKELGDTTSLFQILWGLIGVTFVGAEFRKTQALAREVLPLARKRRDPVFLVLGHMESGGIAFTLGEPASAPKHFREAERFYRPSQHASHVSRFGADLGLFSRSWATHFEWHQGYPDRARAKAEETMKLAGDLAHPFSRAITLAYAAMLHQFCRDLKRVDSLTEATIKVCAEHGFPYYLAWAEVLRGWRRAMEGGPEEGLAEIRHGIEALRVIAGARMPYYRTLLAEVCELTGKIDEAHQALADALTEIGNTEERWWESEVHRLRGELLRRQGPRYRAEAESCFQMAIEVARAQTAKSLELRAAVSLGKLWQEEGRREEAHRLVSEVHAWFKEGFDTLDLREARSLM
jgi:DNA-binding winged helix-turn-helix (wHTH) protein/predicted ATPase